MIQINLDQKSDTFIDIIKKHKNEKIIIFDLLDPISLYPYDRPERVYEFKHEKFEKNYIYSIFAYLDQSYYENLHFITADVNILKSYANVKNACILKNIIDDDTKDFSIHVYPWVFAHVMNGNFYHLNEENIKNIKYKYNVCFLSLESKLIRQIIISKLIEHDKFIYSNIGSARIQNTPDVQIKHIHPIHDFNFELHYDQFYRRWQKEYNADDILGEVYIKNSNYDSRVLKTVTEDYSLYKYRADIERDLLTKRTEFQYFCPKEYFESAINLFSETSVISSSITEKFFKDVYNKKLSIGIAGQNYYKFLRNNNFMLFEEIFDYSFDNKSLHKRFQSVIDQIKKFLNYKTSDLIEILNDKIIIEKFNNNIEIAREKQNDYTKLMNISSSKLSEYFCEMIIDNDERFRPSIL